MTSNETLVPVVTENVIETPSTAKETTCLAITKRHSTTAETAGSQSVTNAPLIGSDGASLSKRSSEERLAKPNCRDPLASGSQNAAPIKVIWEFWRMTQSEYHYREVGIVDLGEIE